MKSIEMFRNFIAKEGANVTILDLSQKYRVDKNGCNGSLLILLVSPFSLHLVMISLKTDNGFPNEEKKSSDSYTLNVRMHQNHFDVTSQDLSVKITIK